MWTCTICGQEITEEGFTTCWNCGTAQGVTPEQAAASKVAQQQQYAKYLQCLRCDGHMQYLGIKKFHEGPITGGGVADFFQKREHYDTFACTRCGKLEFYLAGKGEDWRGPSQ